MHQEVPVVELLGMRIARLGPEAVVDWAFTALERGEGGWILTATLDYLQRHASDPASRALYAGADLIVPDGMPLVWAARLQGTPLPARVAGSDLVWLLAERAARQGARLYLLGGDPGVGERAAQRFRERSPSLRIAGVSSPRISEVPTPAEIGELRSALLEAQPDLVYVALGTPKQDRVIAALREALPRAWWMGVGISLSFVAGEVARAPRWMQRAGLEWIHRLLQEPLRLSRRYLLANLPFSLRLMASAWRART